jgi:hypothetical protein
MALYTGSPVFLSHTTVVSRWLVIPTAARLPEFSEALDRAWATASRVLSQISFGSCSTQPAFGKICSCSSCPTETISPEWLNTIARDDVVPWSTASTYFWASLIV